MKRLAIAFALALTVTSFASAPADAQGRTFKACQAVEKMLKAQQSAANELTPHMNKIIDVSLVLTLNDNDDFANALSKASSGVHDALINVLKESIKIAEESGCLGD